MSLTIFAQETAKINQNEFVEAHHDSKLLAREVSYRIILPADYKESEKKRFAVIYLLHGRGGNYKDWTNLTKITQYSLIYNFIIVMPDGGKESWYADNVN
ncbi:MAG: esterase family protein, partial [Acidobacteriota bacterium]|nr:esterase family protein [Acidobacteriota bacterium]